MSVALSVLADGDCAPVDWGNLDDALRAAVSAVLHRVPDPEVPVMSVMDLGIVRDLALHHDATLEIGVTPTYSGCPAVRVIERDIERALRGQALPSVHDIRVVRRLSPPWSTDRIGAAGREKLRAAGIAPPEGEPRASLWGDGQPVACPACGSRRTEKVSEFGATPCKAAWRCLACLEPFEYFKCI